MASGPLRFNGHIVLRPERISKILRDPNGMVLRRLIEDAELVKREAQRLVGVSKPDPVPRRKPRVPGQLRASIVKRVVIIGGVPRVMVGSPSKIALFHHEGTQPHTITARRAPMLVFFWPKTGTVVHFKSVHHPGTKPNRFLVKALGVLKGRYR